MLPLHSHLNGGKILRASRVLIRPTQGCVYLSLCTHLEEKSSALEVQCGPQDSRHPVLHMLFLEPQGQSGLKVLVPTLKKEEMEKKRKETKKSCSPATNSEGMQGPSDNIPIHMHARSRVNIEKRRNGQKEWPVPY